MKSAIIITAILLAISIFKLSTRTQATPKEVIAAFKEWSKTHNKEYTTPGEFVYRLAVFYKNYLEVRDHNNKNALWEAGFNQFSDLTLEEVIAKYTGYRPSDRPKNYAHFPNKGLTQTSAWDWRDHGAVNPVQDQGQCGSCWAFSAVAALEGVWFVNKGSLLKFSEQELVDCSGKYGNYGCNGGLMDNAFNYVKDHGIHLEKEYPYYATDRKCKVSGTPSGHDTGFHDVTPKSSSALHDAVRQNPTSIAVEVNNNFQMYSRGIFADTSCGTRLNHGIAAVGFGSADGKNFWIVRNSWGARWGENGYIRILNDMTEGHPGICGMYTACSYPTV